MNLWDRIIEGLNGALSSSSPWRDSPRDASRFVVVDAEVGATDRRIHDLGALRADGATFHSADRGAFMKFVQEAHFVCGHNILHHDAKYLFGSDVRRFALVDTLYLSPLLFPERPYHRLLKDDKLLTDQVNNPVNDCVKCRDLLMDEVARWNGLSEPMRLIFATLLRGHAEYDGFLAFVSAQAADKRELPGIILDEFRGRICEHAPLKSMINRSPCELAYALALVNTTDHRSVTPPWVIHNFPNVENAVRLLRHHRCSEGCAYCDTALDVKYHLRQMFGFSEFRTYGGEPLQQSAAQAAVDRKSLLAIFPTGGGKSLTFQLPALMEGRSVHGLTVVISPLQSLMKDQVDNLAERGITDAVAINGLLDPISRAEAINRVISGDASLLYISPEMLRSYTIERVLMTRNISRVVVDEAHCFSAWGQDFRVDYLYIGPFIRQYQEKKRLAEPIPVSCFTATAKQKVIQDIRDYFKRTLGLDMELFATAEARANLHYSVIHADSDEDKYAKLRSLVAEAGCPTIVYVSRTKRTEELAMKLTRDGFRALPYHGRMKADQKVANQEAFMSEQARVIVATSAFGMGVDKKNVGMVVHYDISDSLENYVQEAGRAGRDPHINARCYVLYSEGDLDKHFVLLNQGKLSISEIQQVWSTVKSLTRVRPSVCCSALEIARAAGWDDSVFDIETRVRAALSALEQTGYLERGKNVPHVYATGITVRNLDEARRRITESPLFEEHEAERAVRIIKSLISQKARSQDGEGESRVDYLADLLGIRKDEIVSCVERMRQEGILADTKDLTAFLNDASISERSSKNMLERFATLERYIMGLLKSEPLRITYKQLNDNAHRDGVDTAKEKDIRTLLYFLTIKGYAMKHDQGAGCIELCLSLDAETALARFEKRMEICRFTLKWLYHLASGTTAEENREHGVRFSVVELLKDFKSMAASLISNAADVQLEDIEEALLYLSRIGAMKLEGGFMVLYNAMSIRRIKGQRFQYKKDDYRLLDEFYRQRMQQIHIVGEYANLMVSDYAAALQFVSDYFQMDYRRFIAKYFKGERAAEISCNITPAMFKKIFGPLSQRQMEIISDKESRRIVVAAGPGSGKTRLLVHKLASLLMLEDVKHEQLLMLTFSRAAAIEFKERLIGLIGNAAHFVEIKTFHSYCFDLLGRIGNLDDADDAVELAAHMIENGDVEPNRIAKTVLVLDEAQDMSHKEYSLVRALMTANEQMRVIAVGDDDQNIYGFRNSDSRFMTELLRDSEGPARIVEMTENYRSSAAVVTFANALAAKISRRMKKHPITPVRPDQGFVGIRRHTSVIMYQPLVDDLLAHRAEGGTACVLTQTNEQAAIIVAMLRRRGLRSRLIQSMENFPFVNMAETRMFLKLIRNAASSPTIPNEVWEHAKSTTFAAYATSAALPYLRRCIEVFERTNKEKFLTDLREHLFESTVEDFTDTDDADVVVSTIHKAKGREFDDVYILIPRPQYRNDEELRTLYVGATRARQRLFIHTDNAFFDSLPANERLSSGQAYDLPDEIMLQLTHKDVNLGFFKHRKRDVLKLRAGENLRFEDNYLFELATNRAVAQLSHKMQDELAGWSARGYAVSSATIRFIVAWRPKDAPRTEEEHAVLLIDLSLARRAISTQGITSDNRPAM